jgi:hypothetical protein
MIYCTLYRDPEFGYWAVNPDRTNDRSASLFYLCQLVLSIFSHVYKQCKHRHILSTSSGVICMHTIHYPDQAASDTYRSPATSSHVNKIPYFSHIKPPQLHTVLQPYQAASTTYRTLATSRRVMQLHTVLLPHQTAPTTYNTFSTPTLREVQWLTQMNQKPNTNEWTEDHSLHYSVDGPTW